MSKIKPGAFATTVILSDSTNIDFDNISSTTRALYVGSGGDVSVEMAGNNTQGGGLVDPTVIFIAVLSGTLLPIEITRVNTTGTTASSIVAIW